jgi:predicted dehydrogenase
MVEDAARVVELAAKRNLVHAVIQNRRFNPDLRRIKRLAMVLGAIESAKAGQRVPIRTCA